MLGGMIEHDTCNTAHSQGNNLEAKIIKMAQEIGIDEEEQVSYQGNCHNYLRNIWMDAVEIFLGKSLGRVLKDDLDLIPPNLHVTCRLSKLLIQIDKEYNFSANYPKGHGDEFHDWLCRYFPGRCFLPAIHVCGGNRQDSAFEGPLLVYDALDEMLKYTVNV